jgi:hypothetical protein
MGCSCVSARIGSQCSSHDPFSPPGPVRAIRPTSVLEGAGFYDPRALVLFDEAVSMGVLPQCNYTAGPITVYAESMPCYVAEVMHQLDHLCLFVCPLHDQLVKGLRGQGLCLLPPQN